MRELAIGVAVAAALLVARSGEAQLLPAPGADRYFRVEWEVKYNPARGAVISGSGTSTSSGASPAKPRFEEGVAFSMGTLPIANRARPRDATGTWPAQLQPTGLSRTGLSARADLAISYRG